MIYSLPNGKVIEITIDQFLDLTDEDIQYLMSINYGEYAPTPWLGASITEKRRKSQTEDEEDRSIDYQLEDEHQFENFSLDTDEEIFIEDLHDIPDESELE